MYVSKQSAKRFCSPKCQSVWQKNNTGYDNPRFEGGTVKCEHCGKEYVVGKYKYNSKQRHFCSAECRRNWYSNVWSQSDEWKDESRKRAVAILKNNPATTQTKPQIAVNTILNKMNVWFINEESFDYYSIDNYLPAYNLAIEVMGDYWHTSPIIYPEIKNDKQRYIISRDKAKHTYIKNKYNIEILYLWESDILNRPELCENLIKMYILNKGVLENYNSFNYAESEDMAVLKPDIIISHQEKIAC